MIRVICILLLKKYISVFSFRGMKAPSAYIYGEGGGYEERIQRTDHHR
jgi:hypothetical protein